MSVQLRKLRPRPACSRMEQSNGIRFRQLTPEPMLPSLYWTLCSRRCSCSSATSSYRWTALVQDMKSLWELGAGHFSWGEPGWARLPWLLWPREEDRPQVGSPSLSQREMSIDGLACDPSQAMAGSALYVVGWVKGRCSQGTLSQNNGKGLHLHETVHLTAITSGLHRGTVESEDDLAAYWELLPRSRILPLQVPCQCLPG